MIDKMAEIISDGIVKQAETNKMTDKDKAVVGGGAVAGTGYMAKKQLDAGNITGRELLYHGTKESNKASILEQGLRSAKANEKDSFTRKVLDHVPDKDLDDLVYLAKKESTARGVNAARANAESSAKIKDVFNSNDDLLGMLKKMKDAAKQDPSTVLKAKVPVWKMNTVDNPELLGAKSKEEFLKRFKEVNPEQVRFMPEPIINLELRNAYDSLGKGTRVVKGDVGAEYIKGSDKYQKAGFDEVKDFISHNKGRFGKGVGAIAGGGAIGAGLGAAYLKHQKNKTASEIIDELTEKTAGYDYEMKLKVSDPDKYFLHLIEKIKNHSDPGHSFDVIVDPHMKKEEGGSEVFGMDGDGGFQIGDIKTKELFQEKTAATRWAKEMIAAADNVKAGKDVYPNLKKFKDITDTVKNPAIEKKVGSQTQSFPFGTEDFLAMKKGEKPKNPALIKTKNKDIVKDTVRPAKQKERNMDDLLDKYFPKKNEPKLAEPQHDDVVTRAKSGLNWLFTL